MNEDVQDIKLIDLLTNKPSDPIEIENSKARIVFQAPPFTEKYKGRAWSAKKLKEIGINDDDDQELAYYFRYWGTLNSYVKTIYVERKDGPIKIGEKSYIEYPFNPSKDLNYKSVFEKFILEEMYPRGLDEAIVTATVIAHMEWVRERSMEEADIKNA